MSSMFGNQNTNPASSSLFGTNVPNPPSTQPGGSLLFGTNPPAGGSVFGGGGIGANNQQGQQQTGGIFGQTQNQPQQQNTGGIFGQSQNQQQGGLGAFGSSGLGNNQQNQQRTGFGLGQTTQQNQQNSSLFGLGSGFGGGLGQSTQQQNNQQPTSLFNTPAPRPLFQQNVQQLAQQQAQLGQNSSIFQNLLTPREKSVPEQMAAIMEQWDTSHSNCAFQYFFYNKVQDEVAPFYIPAEHEDKKKWEEALQNKPGPGYIPVLCKGFEQMGERIKVQQTTLAAFNSKLHEINNCLTLLLQDHDTNTSIRAMDAKRKHIVLKQRCLALATKVQVLRNRGYAMGGDEEDLRTKLMELEKGVNDPGLGARAEEIWARMITVQERARLLRSEIEKSGSQSLSILDETTEQRVKQILEDYQTQMVHLKKELDKIQADYVEWEKEHPKPPAPKTNGQRYPGGASQMQFS